MSTVFPNIKTFFFYGIGAASLIALAEYLPKVAIMFTIILIAGVFLTHWKEYAPLLSGNLAKGKK
jgi:hypothetical protein